MFNFLVPDPSLYEMMTEDSKVKFGKTPEPVLKTTLKTKYGSTLDGAIKISEGEKEISFMFFGDI